MAGLAAATLLSACGGPEDEAASVTPQGPMLDEARVARFLMQAGLGATVEDVAAIGSQGLEAWLDAQLRLPLTTPGACDWAVMRGYDAPAYYGGDEGVDAALWSRLLSAPDTVRQRMTLAWSQILVVSASNMATPWGQFAALAYWDTLERHALGTFRELLEAVTLSPAMGVYLSMRGSRKADGQGRQPDENYAREILQLFTIGLTVLGPDGRPQDDPPRATYGSDDVSGLARVFTGWDFDWRGIDLGLSERDRGHAHLRRPMVHDARFHETGEKVFLGLRIPAGTDGPTSLRLALDHLAQHPNVGPFLARRLIQQLVTSNPDPAYVRRVAAVFDDNGRGVRGDLQAVFRAIVLDAAARPAMFGDQAMSHGKLREPILRFVHWARLFRVQSAPDAVTGLSPWRVPNLAPATLLGQSPLRAPSVFNFYRPDYVPPGTSLAQAGWVAPEFQITDEASVIGYANFMYTIVGAGGADIAPDYVRDGWLTLARDPAALVARLNTLLTGGALLSGDDVARVVNELSLGTFVDNLALITEAVSEIDVDLRADAVVGQGYAMATPTGDRWVDGDLARVVTAVFMVLCSPDFLVQR